MKPCSMIDAADKMTLKTKTDLLAALEANPTERLWWNITTGKRGIYTFKNETVLARVAEAVIVAGNVKEQRRGASWNVRAYRFMGTD